MVNPASIGQVAKQTGISVETIRSYERKQLIEAPARKKVLIGSFHKEISSVCILFSRRRVLAFP